MSKSDIKFQKEVSSMVNQNFAIAMQQGGLSKLKINVC